MQDGTDAPNLLRPLLPRLEALGLAQIAERLRVVAASLEAPLPPVPADHEVLSLSDAVRVLELRSPTTVRGLIDAGCLEGFARAGEIVVSRRSIDALLDSPRLAGQRILEAQLWSVLDDL